MSYSVDVNLLLYASDASSPFHERARGFLESCVQSTEPCFLPFLTLMSYLRIATHPRIFTEPLTPEQALSNVVQLSDLPQVRLVSEREGFLDFYDEITRESFVRANLVPDAHLAAILRQNGVSTLYTNNEQDFARYAFLDVRNPVR